MLMNMKEILNNAYEYNFAVPAFNISNYSMLIEVLKTCKEYKSPVIIAIHPDELSHIGCEMLNSIVQLAYKAPIPICVHLDHGRNISEVISAIQAGFTSVMIDGSCLPFKENVSICKQVVEIAHCVDVSVEGELGTIGVADNMGEAGSTNIIYTKSEDAVCFVKETQIDSLAVAIGTSHGLYPKNMQPKLNIQLLKEIKTMVHVPLVLHGGSGNSDKEIAEAVKYGINKINISSDIKDAYYKEMRNVLKDLKVREPNVIEPPCMNAMRGVVVSKIKLFQSEGKASLY